MWCCEQDFNNWRILPIETTELQKMLSWKGPSRFIKSNVWRCAGHHKNHIVCLGVLSKHFLNADRFNTVATSLVSLALLLRELTAPPCLVLSENLVFL